MLKTRCGSDNDRERTGRDTGVFRSGRESCLRGMHTGTQSALGERSENRTIYIGEQGECTRLAQFPVFEMKRNRRENRPSNRAKRKKITCCGGGG